ASTFDILKAVLAALSRIVFVCSSGANGPDIASEGMAVKGGAGHRSLPEIVENALLAGRQVEDQWTILAKIDITHGIDDVRIGRGHERLCAQALLPHRQDIVTGTKARF